MEDKDPKDDELNQEGQDDINDADDSFGLPDLDYKPLEDDDDTPEEEIVVEEETTETEFFSEETESSDDSHYEEMEEKEEEPVRRYSSYRQDESDSNAPKIIIAVIAVIIIAAGIWYFGFYRPAEAEREMIEMAEAQRLEKIRLAEMAAAQQAEDEAAIATEEVIDEVVAESLEVVERGGITTISEPTSRYYVVIGSFIDVDLATDLGKELAAKGVNTSLISPFSKKRLFRLCVASFGTYGDATAAANDLKAEYGENLWVLKY